MTSSTELPLLLIPRKGIIDNKSDMISTQKQFDFTDILRRQAENTYFGAVVGRVANRIAEGKLFIDGQEYSLATNNGPHHLHGGNKGWDKVIWKSRRFKHHEGDAVELTYTSKDGEEVIKMRQ